MDHKAPVHKTKRKKEWEHSKSRLSKCSGLCEKTSSEENNRRWTYSFGNLTGSNAINTVFVIILETVVHHKLEVSL